MVKRKNFYLEESETMIVKKGETWAPEYRGYTMIAMSDDSTLRVYGSLIGEDIEPITHTIVDVSSYATHNVKIIVGPKGEIINNYSGGYAIGFSSAGLIKNAGTIGEIFMGGQKDDPARLVNSGTIFSDDGWGVGTSSSGMTEIENSGKISGETGVAILSRHYGTSSTTIENSGVITGKGNGITVGFELGGQSDVSLINTGKISGNDFSFQSLIDDKDEIINHGLMRGDVELSGGNDLYDASGSRGRVVGTVKGGSGHDELFGGKKSDHFIGGAGRDELRGGGGDDVLSGGGGRDELYGGNGDDILKGGKGSDVFVFSSGSDRVLDFDTTRDGEVIDLSRSDIFSGYKDLIRDHIRQSSEGVIIDDGLGNTLTLEGVVKSDLDASDFIF